MDALRSQGWVSCGLTSAVLDSPPPPRARRRRRRHRRSRGRRRQGVVRRVRRRRRRRTSANPRRINDVAVNPPSKFIGSTP
eukprot:4430767-Pyramimonas_sp.AAC.1